MLKGRSIYSIKCVKKLYMFGCCWQLQQQDEHNLDSVASRHKLTVETIYYLDD